MPAKINSKEWKDGPEKGGMEQKMMGWMPPY